MKDRLPELLRSWDCVDASGMSLECGWSERCVLSVWRVLWQVVFCHRSGWIQCENSSVIVKRRRTHAARWQQVGGQDTVKRRGLWNLHLTRYVRFLKGQEAWIVGASVYVANLYCEIVSKHLEKRCLWDAQVALTT